MTGAPASVTISSSPPRQRNATSQQDVHFAPTRVGDQWVTLRAKADPQVPGPRVVPGELTV